MIRQTHNYYHIRNHSGGNGIFSAKDVSATSLKMITDELSLGTKQPRL